MLNFLYAFDKNYNLQGYTSIFSLLESVNEKINITLLLDASNFNQEIPLKIKNHKNLNLLNKKYLNLDKEFYNLEDSHVSKATFYRLYIDNSIESSSQYLIYLDCDVISLKNPIPVLYKIIEKMIENKLPFAMADELYRSDHDEAFQRLSMSSDKYFNAGFMIIDLKNWVSNNLTDKSIQKINLLKDKAKFWDQDILNSLIDGNYLSLSSGLNYKSFNRAEVVKKIYFLHFSGKTKPWEVGGYYENFAEIYHDNYKKLFGEEFHITCKNRKNSILRLLSAFRKTRVNFKFIKYLVKSLIVILKKLN